MAEKHDKDTDAGEWEIVDLSDWRMKQIQEFNNLRVGALAGRIGLDDLYEVCAGIVVKWPFEGDPTNPADYGNLFPLQWMAVQAKVNESVQALFLQSS